MKLPGMKNEPKTPDTPEVSKEPEAPKRQRVGVDDVFRLPVWISKADQTNFYYRWPRESNWYKLQNAGYEKVKDEDGNMVRMPTKDSEDDHILVRLPIEYRLEDLEHKRLRANEGAKAVNIKDAGVSAYDAVD